MDHRHVRALFIGTGILAAWLRSGQGDVPLRVAPPTILEDGSEQPALRVVPSSDLDLHAGTSAREAGRGVRATPEQTRAAQQFYLTRLRSEATPAVRREFDRARRALLNTAEAPDEFSTNARLIAWLLARVEPADAVRLAQVNQVLGGEAASR